MQNFINLLKRFFSIFLALGNKAADSIESQVNILEQKTREEETKVKNAEDKLTDLMAQLELIKGDEKHAESERVRFEKLALDAHTAGNATDAADFAEQAERWGDQEKIYEDQIVQMESAVEQLTVTIDNAINNIGKMQNEIKTVMAQSKANEASLSIAKTLNDLDSDGLTAQMKKIKEKTRQDGEKAKAMIKRREGRESIESRAKAYEGGNTGGSALDKLLASQKPKEDQAA